MMADLGVEVGAAAGVLVAIALERSMSARVRPAPKAPILRKLRRLMPSQNLGALPSRLIIGPPYSSVGYHNLALMLICIHFGCKTNLAFFSTARAFRRGVPPRR